MDERGRSDVFKGELGFGELNPLANLPGISLCPKIISATPCSSLYSDWL